MNPAAEFLTERGVIKGKLLTPEFRRAVDDSPLWCPTCKIAEASRKFSKNPDETAVMTVMVCEYFALMLEETEAGRKLVVPFWQNVQKHSFPKKFENKTVIEALLEATGA